MTKIEGSHVELRLISHLHTGGSLMVGNCVLTHRPTRAGEYLVKTGEGSEYRFYSVADAALKIILLEGIALMHGEKQ